MTTGHVVVDSSLQTFVVRQEGYQCLPPHRRDGTPYDYHRGLYSFRMKSRIKDVGVYRPLHRWEFGGGVSRLTADLSGLDDAVIRAALKDVGQALAVTPEFDPAALSGAELVVGRGWLGLRSHPQPAASIALGGSAR